MDWRKIIKRGVEIAKEFADSLPQVILVPGKIDENAIKKNLAAQEKKYGKKLYQQVTNVTLRTNRVPYQVGNNTYYRFTNTYIVYTDTYDNSGTLIKSNNQYKSNIIGTSLKKGQKIYN